MKKSFGIRFVLAAMIALAVAVTGCGDDNGGTAGSGGGTAGTGGSGGGTAGTGGSGGGTAGTGGSGGGTAGTGGSGGGTAGTGGSGGGTAGTGGSGGTGGGGTPVSFATDIQPYFEIDPPNCVSCHNDNFAQDGAKLDSHANFLADGVNGVPPVVAGDSTMGTLVPQLEANHQNPPGDVAAFLVTLKEWIDDGAPNN